MFKVLSRSYFFACVQAELKAQYSDQAFVEHVCQGEMGASHFNERLDEWRDRTRGIKPAKLRFFIMTCGVLGDRLTRKDLPNHELDLCAKLLLVRCAQIHDRPDIKNIVQDNYAVWMAEIDSRTALGDAEG
ncbi:hypothetical protein K3740_08695 [Ruegeria conchae]|uniref:hypothetical protein n=1 Tax=Ruegeria conchae TaxID=981384 RepID=UPI0021A76FDC|nr:hypothetical protein [Ruegeria conchae]UWR04738.1 hypothetical protein K3740_08695 [Ruegeria conchae]